MLGPQTSVVPEMKKEQRREPESNQITLACLGDLGCGEALIARRDVCEMEFSCWLGGAHCAAPIK